MTTEPQAEPKPPEGYTQDITDFLVAVRDSGQHPLSAGPNLQDVFGITRYQARDYIVHWMKTYRP